MTKDNALQPQVEMALLLGDSAKEIAERLGLSTAESERSLYDSWEGDAVLLPGWYVDDGHSGFAELLECDTAREAADEYVENGSYGNDESTVWVDVTAWRRGLVLEAGVVCEVEVDHTDVCVTVDPPAPPCLDEHKHVWRAPYSIVGGCEENPGIWGHGGGVYITTCCMNCGCKRTVDTWATNPCNGEQGLRSVSYMPVVYAEQIAQRAAARAAKEGTCDDSLDSPTSA